MLSRNLLPSPASALSPRACQAYKLPILSGLPLPELPGSEDCNPAEVIIQSGKVRAHLDDATPNSGLFEVSAGKFLLRLDGIARYQVANGAEILIDPDPAADPASVRLFLLGSVFGALLYQRGLLPLHASAIETPRGAVILAGRSGTGKSALAGAFYARGYRIIADEIAAIDCSGAGARILSSCPRLLLWPDVIGELGLWTADVRLARPKIEKYNVPLGDRFTPDPSPIYAIYILQVANTGSFAFTRVSGAEKVQELINIGFRRRFISGMISGKAYFDGITCLARNTAISRFIRPFSLSVRESADLLERDFNR